MIYSFLLLTPGNSDVNISFYRRPSTLPLLAVFSLGSLYAGLKAKTIMARRERAANGQEKNYEVRTHRSGE